MKYIFRLTAAVLACVALCAVMTACYEAPPTVIDPVDDTVTTTTAPAEDEPTGPIKPTLSDIVVLHKSTLRWDDLKVFEHTMTGDNTAHFDVVSDNGNLCALDVVIDSESGLVTEATLSYEDLSQTLLTDDIFELTDFVRAVN